MKGNYIKFCLFVLFISSFCFSQNRNDSLKIVLASSNFTLEEEYIGDWGWSLTTFMFTKKNNTATVTYKMTYKRSDISEGNSPKSLEIDLSANELEEFKKIITDCLNKINTSKKGSTEYIRYHFKSDACSYIIDDKSTMACDENFKIWKERILSKKQQ